MVAGVCGGLGEYFDLDPIIFRIIFLVMVLGGGSGLLVYLVLAIVIPRDPGDNPGKNPEANRPAGSADDKIKGFANEIRQGVQELADEVRQDSGRLKGDGRNVVGFVLVALGLVFLFDQVFPWFRFRWDIFWPALVIIAGVAILMKRK